MPKTKSKRQKRGGGGKQNEINNNEKYVQERERERERVAQPVWFVPHATLTIVSPAREAIALGRGWAS